MLIHLFLFTLVYVYVYVNVNIFVFIYLYIPFTLCNYIYIVLYELTKRIFSFSLHPKYMYFIGRSISKSNYHFPLFLLLIELSLSGFLPRNSSNQSWETLIIFPQPKSSLLFVHQTHPKSSTFLLGS